MTRNGHVIYYNPRKVPPVVRVPAPPPPARRSGWEEALYWTLVVIFTLLFLAGIVGSYQSPPPAPQPIIVPAPPSATPGEIRSAGEPEDLGYGTGLPTPLPLEVEIAALRTQLRYEHKRAEMYAAALHLLLGANLSPLN